MRKPESDLLRVRHALEAAQKALRHASNSTRQDLDEDERLAFTLIHLLEVLGEACNQVSRPFQERHPRVPWKKAIDLRHRLSHGYFDVNLDIVWATVTESLPGLVASLEDVLRKEEAL